MANKDIRRTNLDIQRELTNPVARGLDTFYRPQVKPVVSQAEKDLVNSLASVVPALTQYQETKERLINEDATAEGMEAYNKNKMAFKEAVKKGIIPEGANPHFIIAYNQMELEDKGRSFANIIKKKYAENQGSLLESTDPEAVSNFIKENLDLFMEENNIDGYASDDIVNHFIPKIDAVESELSNNIANGRIAIIQNKAEQSFSSGVYELIEDGFDLDDENGISIIGQKINQEILKYGDVKTTASLNKLAVTSIITYAEQNLDLDALDILGEIKTQGGKTLADIPEFIALVDASEQKIIADIKSNLDWKSKNEKDKRDKAHLENITSFSAYQTEVGGAISISPKDVETWLIKNNVTDPATKTYIRSLYNNALTFSNQAIEDTSVIEDIDNAIFEDPYNPEIQTLIEQAVTNGDISSSRAMGYQNTILTQQQGSQSPLLNTDLIGQLELQGTRLIQQADLPDSIDKAITVNRFQASLTNSARIIAVELENDDTIAESQKAIEFDKRIRAEYERLATIYQGIEGSLGEQTIEEATLEADNPKEAERIEGINKSIEEKTEKFNSIKETATALMVNLNEEKAIVESKLAKIDKKISKTINKRDKQQLKVDKMLKEIEIEKKNKNESFANIKQSQVDEWLIDIQDYNEDIQDLENDKVGLDEKFNKLNLEHTNLIGEMTALNREILSLKQEL